MCLSLHTTSSLCLMLSTCVSQLAQVEGGSLKIFYVPADHYCFHTLPQSSTFCFPSPPPLSLPQNRSNLSVECVQVCTYSGHRDGVWQVSHARNGLPVIGSASAGILVE